MSEAEVLEKPERTEAQKKTLANLTNVGFTKEMREAKRIKEEEAQEKRRLELRARQGEIASKNRMAGHHPELKNGTNVQKIDVIIGKFVGQLIEENRGKGLVEVDYTNKEAVQRRKDQMSVIKEHIGLIKQLKDVRALLAEEDEGDNKKNLQTAENLELIDSAKELLAKKGIKTDF